jgi:ribosome-associated translation inhibitor RaiA
MNRSMRLPVRLQKTAVRASRRKGQGSRVATARAMAFPLRITFRDVERSDALEARVRRHADKLGTFDERIVTCRVAIEAPHRHKHHGRHYRVRIDLAVPGAELVADRCPDEGQGSEDVYTAVDRTFDHVARLLHEHLATRAAHR